MDIFADLTGNRLTVGKTSDTTLDRLGVHQGDTDNTLRLWLLQQTGVATAPFTVVALPAAFDAIAFGARPSDNLMEASLLFAVTDWTPVGTGQDLHYEAVLDLNTAPIAAKFPADNLTKRSIDALLDLQLTKAAGTARRTVARQWPVTITRDIFRGDEGVPTSGDPVYPLPGALVTKAPTDGGYRFNGVNFQLWNATQGIYQTVYLAGAPGAEHVVIG